jgi:hypothetical protein
VPLIYYSYQLDTGKLRSVKKQWMTRV